MKAQYYSHGKLLLTGEYVVLDGAQALALPTKKGQRLELSTNKTNTIQWTSLLADGNVWLEYEQALPLAATTMHTDPLKERLNQILLAAQELNPECLSAGIHFKSVLEFNRSWGLGSSSTLINNVAQWAKVNPYALLQKTFGGSGYDIACAGAEGPIIYKNTTNAPKVTNVIFDPNFKEELFFVHLNRKQNSRDSISHYREAHTDNLGTAIAQITDLTEAIMHCEDIRTFENLLEQHELIISELIKTPTIKNQLFADYPRTIKSLGGWGGDFVLATGGMEEQGYFRKKGYQTVISYKEMVL